MKTKGSRLIHSNIERTILDTNKNVDLHCTRIEKKNMEHFKEWKEEN